MAKRLLPSLNRVLVEKLVQPKKTAGGILLPETSKQVAPAPTMLLLLGVVQYIELPSIFGGVRHVFSTVTCRTENGLRLSDLNRLVACQQLEAAEKSSPCFLSLVKLVGCDQVERFGLLGVGCDFSQYWYLTYNFIVKVATLCFFNEGQIYILAKQHALWLPEVPNCSCPLVLTTLSLFEVRNQFFT